MAETQAEWDRISKFYSNVPTPTVILLLLECVFVKLTQCVTLIASLKTKLSVH